MLPQAISICVIQKCNGHIYTVSMFQHLMGFPLRNVTGAAAAKVVLHFWCTAACAVAQATTGPQDSKACADVCLGCNPADKSKASHQEDA